MLKISNRTAERLVKNAVWDQRCANLMRYVVRHGVASEANLWWLNGILADWF